MSQQRTAQQMTGSLGKGDNLNTVSLVIINRYNDRGSVNSYESEVIGIDVSLMETNKPLPGWKWKCEEEMPPMVRYYDGEQLELDFGQKVFSIRVGGEQAELLEAYCPENIYVHESRVIAIRLEKLGTPHQLPSWHEMFRNESFNAIVVNALPSLGTDPTATRWFVRIFTSKENVFFLLPDTVSLIEKSAEAGNPYALFALGRYHYNTQHDEDSTEKAMDCFKKAWSQGMAEAAVALSIAYDYGDLGIVDRIRAKSLLAKALETDCEYAAEYHIKRMIYGQCGVPANTQLALQLCEDLIAKDIENYGQDEVNPKWYYYKGCAKQTIHGWAHGLEEFQIAADAGLVGAWLDIVIASSHNDQGEVINVPAYWAAIRKGTARRCAICAYYNALSKVEDYENMPEYRQRFASRQLMIDLEKAYELGSNEATEMMGDIYYYGNYGIEEDNEKAFQYYAKGALRYSAICFEKMFDMIHKHYIDKPLEFKDMLALQGGRNGSQRLLSETVIAYTQGRLTDYAAEIEQYYVPLFDKENKDDTQDNDPVDDDGRFDAYV